MSGLRISILSLLVLLTSSVSYAFEQDNTSVVWSISTTEVEDDIFELRFNGKIPKGLHSYPLSSDISAPEIIIDSLISCEKIGELLDLSKTEKFHEYDVVYDKLVLVQKFKVTGTNPNVKGCVISMTCDDSSCNMPTTHEFNISIKHDNVNIWSLILSAILWGLAMVLTPCVFPMVPMTVSYFLKGSSSPAKGRFNAFMYGLFIVLLYTIPISLVIFITWLIGGDAVTADIFNWLATHWLPNIIFFIVFMIFAASFFGAFEITMPSALVNKADGKSDKGGLGGIFFMALTLVLVSFSCTGPIVGTVLIQSTQGQFWVPMITMFAFSVSFALPFTIFAFFPSLLKKMKSGSWMNSVKVVLGFIELALGLKFLSVADQTYHWGLLDREVYLAIWIVIFSLLGFYLLGKIRFSHEEKIEKINVLRLSLSILVFSFVVYMIPGMFGAPLQALSGYIPPITTQDFVLTKNQAYVVSSTNNSEESISENAYKSKYDLHLPLGIEGYFTLEEGIEVAQKMGKPILVDITGHGCVNCREMESKVWSDSRVLEMLKNKFVVVALYVDDKLKLKEEDYLTTNSGDVIKELGRANSYIARTKFNVNSQPNYILLDSNGNQIASPRGYDTDVESYIEFLNQAL